jgi:pyrimidine-specific ribonucleoside hydrolase
MRVIVDTDPGVDDAIALLYLLASPDVDVLAVTTVHGNVSVADATTNARRVLRLAGGDDIPVVQGAARSLPPTGSRPDSAGCAAAGDVVVTHAAQAPLSILAIGPLTNLALLLQRCGGLPAGVQRIVMMGACFAAEPEAEFNASADPEALAAVLGCGVPVTVAPYDVTRTAELPLTAFTGLAPGSFRRAVLRLVAGRVADAGVILHDVVAAVALRRPDLLTTVTAAVAVDGPASARPGHTSLLPSRSGTVQVGRALDIPAYVGEVAAALRRYS